MIPPKSYHGPQYLHPRRLSKESGISMSLRPTNFGLHSTSTEIDTVTPNPSITVDLAYGSPIARYVATILLGRLGLSYQHSVGANLLNVSLPRLNKSANITVQWTSLRLMWGRGHRSPLVYIKAHSEPYVIHKTA